MFKTAWRKRSKITIWYTSGQKTARAPPSLPLFLPPSPSPPLPPSLSLSLSLPISLPPSLSSRSARVRRDGDRQSRAASARRQGTRSGWGGVSRRLTVSRGGSIDGGVDLCAPSVRGAPRWGLGAPRARLCCAGLAGLLVECARSSVGGVTGGCWWSVSGQAWGGLPCLTGALLHRKEGCFLCARYPCS